MPNTIEIVVSARDQGASATFDKMEGRAEGFRGSLKRVGETAAGFLSGTLLAGAGQAALNFFGDATSGARDLEDSLSKTRAVFDTSAPAIESWAKNAANSIGLAEGAALDAAGGFGNMFDQLGFGDQQAADMSMTMGNLAADFASFHGADITEVLDAQSAAFRGEYDALQRFLPLISAASVEQKAMEQTGKGNADQLTAAEKAMATYTLMLEGAGEAQGDFARTSESATNKEARARAEMENMTTQIGTKLLPVQMALTQAKLKFAQILAEKVVPVVEKVVTFFREHEGVAKALAAVIGGVLIAATVAWGAALIAANAPLIAIGVAVGALAYLIVTHWETIKAATLAVFNFVKDTISGVIDWVTNNWPLLVAILTGPIGAAAYVIVSHWETIKAGFTAVKDWIGARIGDIVGFFTGLGGRLASAAGSLWGWIGDQFRAAINGVIRAWNNFKIPSITIGGYDIPGPGPNVPSFTTPEINTPNIPLLARGGVAGGLNWLHDQGPELVRLPQGSLVYPSGQSRQMAAAAGPTRIELVFSAPPGASDFERLFVSMMQKYVRTNAGGDVQAALGWTQ